MVTRLQLLRSEAIYYKINGFALVGSDMTKVV